ncbi:MAG: ATP-dependent DNA helicase [Casimicrobiaceae bacterium]|nr:ATP-dependent DNA helicase [Casimicrobiaceae bacterium]MCX8099418.1 ATP-dependent DNA helicase [Casimicrobiaceae bacterium]MDW8311807.1 ATP-dependent DNA helicase [Burkholderiales bacterium]
MPNPVVSDSPSAAQSEIAALFAPDGALARTATAYRFRPQQVAMAEAVAKAIEERAVLVAEAGTGTGKTYAYLVPALRSGGRIVIATGTKTLQDQLFERDLPRVRAALQVPVTAALLKGRANYVCHYHLDRTRREGRLPSREALRDLDRVTAFAERSSSGDRAECTAVPEHSPVWPLVTSTRENCLGSDCPYQRDCFVLKARREALASDVVVVNHHLFFADLALKDDGLGELLPACNTVVIDEAHRVPEVASLFFAESTSLGQILELSRDAEVAQRTAAPEAHALLEATRLTALAGRQLRAAMPAAPGRLSATCVLAQGEAEPALKTLIEQLSILTEQLKVHAERERTLAALATRAGELVRRLSAWQDGEPRDGVRWCDLSANGWTLVSSPVSVAPLLRSRLQGKACAWIFTSATLSAGGDFSLFLRELGLEEARTASWPSPFDYANAGWIYVPQGLPPPDSPEHTQAVIAEAEALVRASRGRAFLLFTSLRAMRQCAEQLPARLRARGLDYPVLVQNEQPKAELLRRFRASGHAVLIGSQSFWEGVDVAGEALSLVLMDKLPFAPPNDPLLAARLERLEADGGDAFRDWQLPHAAILLKQGAGRLIRSESDRGVIALCDERILTKRYGRLLRESLPPMPWTRDRSLVERFFNTAGGASSP